MVWSFWPMSQKPTNKQGPGRWVFWDGGNPGVQPSGSFQFLSLPTAEHKLTPQHAESQAVLLNTTVKLWLLDIGTKFRTLKTDREGRYIQKNQNDLRNIRSLNKSYVHKLIKTTFGGMRQENLSNKARLCFKLNSHWPYSSMRIHQVPSPVP